MAKSLFTKLLIFLLTGITSIAFGQTYEESTFSGLKFRSLGPAFTSGRIADIAIHPENDNVWYVAVGSGGVWKTQNAGTTWQSIFDGQQSYSIGCLTLDPSNPETVWVGTGENVGGRHVGFGDGVYKSTDGGKTWQKKGLPNSEHISKIIIHPDNPEVVWVAAQGPLWSKGGERGLYKTTDGGTTWAKTLGDAEWTGVTDLLIDPRNPDVLYAATWQRHRTVAAYMGGGPESGLHKSTDGGLTWTKLTTGIPEANIGKIGLAMSPFNPEVIYAAIELERLKGGVFISENGGASWVKQSDAVSGGTGPHYYQELYASPHQEGKLFLMSNYTQVSDDHGKTFTYMNEENKHVDSHAVAFKKSDPNYILFGTDGGLYETYDDTKSWKFIGNLPLTQYYKVAVDDAEPFYHIYGGTQDNGSHGGPSQNRYADGISDRHWWKTLGADGHQSATEPGNPNISYGEFQQGYLWRIDQTTGETVFIQPQPGKEEPYERFNWDAPILVSPHKPSRLYFASYRVWKSEDRGDSWTAISDDLTRNQERLALPIMGKQQSWDNAWDVNAMSNYNTITSLAESPKQEGLLYAGTDDGIIQISENGGESWRKVELGSITGVPATAFVNDVRADLYDANTVYAALDNHKYGDYKPYLLKSTDRGNTWQLMNGNLPQTLLTWRLVQDHVDQNLLFAATEFGIYFTKDGGSNWVKMTGGLPNISFRDITIQRRENDLVAASFGRGFFVLDDISPLRSVSPELMEQEAALFPVADADWFTQRNEGLSAGDAVFYGENPPFGAVFTYHLKEKMMTLKEQRKETEKALTEQGSDIPFPGWEALDQETLQMEPMIWFTVRNAAGKVVNRVKGQNAEGIHRAYWDLSYADRGGVQLDERDGETLAGSGTMATPGTYTVTMSKVVDGVMTDLSEPMEFKVVPLSEGALKGADYAEIEDFREEFHQFQQDFTATRTVLQAHRKKVEAMIKAFVRATEPTEQLMQDLFEAKMALQDLHEAMYGSPAKNEIGERNDPTPSAGLGMGYRALSTTYGPTENHVAAFKAAKEQLQEIKSELKTLSEEKMPALEQALKNAGAPWMEGQGLIGE